VRNMETSSGSAPQVAAWQADREGGGIPGRERMLRKRMPAAERQQESTAGMPGFSAGRLCITDRIPGLVPGRESALTWAGEPLKEGSGNRWSRRAS
jgi:hypothetical protein